MLVLCKSILGGICIHTPDFFALIYIIFKQAPLCFFRYYAFSDRIRCSHKVFIGAISLLFLIEWIIYFKYDSFTLLTLYLYPFIYLVFCFSVSKVNIFRQLFLSIILAYLSLIYQTVAVIADNMYGEYFTPYFLMAVSIIACQLLFFTPIWLFIKKYRYTLLHTKAINIIAIVDIILSMNLSGIITFNSFSSKYAWHQHTWEVLYQRLFYAIPVLLFVYLVLYLLKEIDANTKMNNTISILEKIHHSEKHFFDFVINTYKNSRRLRHDLRHHALIFKEYLALKQYDKLDTYLNNFIDYTDKLKKINLSGNEIIDGIVGYWQMQAEDLNIKFTADIKIEDIKIEDTDLAIVLGNILENAITAAKAVALLHDSFIHLKMTTKNEMVLITLKNTYANKIITKDSAFYSEKRAFKETGIGLENVKLVINKYNGYIKIEHDDSLFTVKLAMNNHSISGGKKI